MIATTHLWGVSKEAAKIGAQLAAMKAKTHQTLTAAKDFAPLVERIDKDLGLLREKKKQLNQLKASLTLKKAELEISAHNAFNQLEQLKEIFQSCASNLKIQIEKLHIINAQKSILFDRQAFAQIASRDTLLSHVFSLKVNALSPHATQGGQSNEDIRG